MKTLISLSSLSALSILRNIAHDVRLVNAVYSPETGRFHPDIREERTQVGRKILSNLFSLATASVSRMGETYNVVARDMNRAAAAVALRDVRRGTVPAHQYDVTMTNRRGLSHSGTVHFGFDAAPIADAADADGTERSNIDRANVVASHKRIDDVTFDETPRGRAMSDAKLDNHNMERAEARKTRDAAIASGTYAEWVSALENQIAKETR